MRGKKKTPEEFKEEAQKILGPDYEILSEYQGSNSYIKIYHKKCNTYSTIRANHILGGTKCKCEYINPFARKDVKEKIKQTNLKKYGTKYPLQSNEVKDKLKQTNLNKYGVENVYQSKEIRSKIVINQKNSISTIDNSKFDSTYERDLYDFCLRNNIEIEDKQIPIKFNYNGKQHITFIDFKIDGYLIECKGSHLLDGLFDYNLPVPIEKKLEIYRENHVILVTDKEGSKVIPKQESENSNGLKYLNKCPNPLIGIDIDLFRNPEIPYKLNRPKCFYDVKVDNNKSVSEAWSDEKIRWNMIKNRINYVGGFINNKSILTAMNVTRTCKQPSWFSKRYAKELIKKYITSDVILDPFAGWGTRCDAAKELNKKYYGWDLNKELVDWHHKKGRTFTSGNGIEHGDANNIKTLREDCSIFICPPYTDLEIYFEGQDITTTQCEWLSIVMENIPNAKEYLMVCKVVDKGFEKYIVEEKVNKSHLGINKEYVLLIK